MTQHIEENGMREEEYITYEIKSIDGEDEIDKETHQN